MNKKIITVSAAVAGCIQDTYPIMATCTDNQMTTIAHDPNAAFFASRCFMKTKMAATKAEPPTKIKSMRPGKK